MPVGSPISDKLKQFFGRSDTALREVLRALSPEELATVIEGLPDKEQRRVFALLPDEKLALVLTHLHAPTLERLLSGASHEKILRLIGFLESDDVADLIQSLDAKKREKLVGALRRSDPKRVLPLLGYEEDTAGGLMKSEVLRAEWTDTVAEARKKIAGSRIADGTSLYVVEPDGRLAGRISLIRLVAAAPDKKLGEVMQKEPPFLPSVMPRDEVVAFFQEHDLLEAPVVDARGKLLGLITADDVLDAVEEEFSEDLSRFVGVSEDEHITDPALSAARRRLPWLIVNLFTAGVAALVVARFEPTIERVAILAALMPVVAGLGGNSATQTLSVTVRAIALGELHAWSTWRVLWRQFLVGLMNGAAVGGLMALVVRQWTGNAVLAAVVFAAMLFNILLGCLIGVAVPVVLRRLRFDPALASSVFLTATTDAMGFLAFLGLASLYL